MTRVKNKTNTEKYKAKRREDKRLSMQRARQKLKQNPEQLEEARKKDRERKKAQRKKIGEMPARQQRAIRKQWRDCSKAYRNKIKMQEQVEIELQTNTPPMSPDVRPINPSVRNNQPSTSRVESGKRTQRKNRKHMKREIIDLKEQNENLKRQVEKYKKRIQRLKSPDSKNTPRKKVKNMLRGVNCPNEIKKQLIFGEVLKKQITINFEEQTNLKKKRLYATFLSGKVVQKYKMMSKVRKITSRRTSNLKSSQPLKNLTGAKKDVEEFLSQDENSKLCAGKKETITRKKVKKQKRLLTDNLKNLYKKFKGTFDRHSKMSYSQFCKLRPFYITIPSCLNRDTCLCKVHTNMELLVSKLNNLGLILEKNTSDVLGTLTCEGKKQELCLQRKCANCKDRIMNINLNDEDKNDTVTYFYWNVIEIEIIVKGNKKKVKKTVKEERNSTKQELVKLFNTLLEKFMMHVFNIKHQYSAIRLVKENLKANEAFLQMDYSENYNCKFAEEIQSLHFGGSREQASLHTSVLYYKNEDNEEFKSQCFCTVSEERRHDATAVCGHLKPIFKEIKNIVPNLTKIHFISDGPSSQYRNRKMFVLLGKYITSLLDVNSINWHYLEAGHGKGAADGVGGCLKRTADNLVAKGTDIPNVPVLVELMNEHCPGIKVIYLTPQEVLECDSFELEVPKFKGTLKTHEICWTVTKPNLLQIRSNSCTSCDPSEKCKHFHLGQIKLNLENSTEMKTKRKTISSAASSINLTSKRVKYNEVYSTDEEEITPNENDFVLVKLCGKKSVKHYVAILTSNVVLDECEVKFMKRSGNHFIFPAVDDVSKIYLNDIVGILSVPVVDNRERYTFNLNQYKKLNIE